MRGAEIECISYPGSDPIIAILNQNVYDRDYAKNIA